MEDADFVADSDEEAQEELEELALAEDRLARERLDGAAASIQEDAQKDAEQEQVAAVVTPERTPTVEEQVEATVEEQEEEEEETTDEEQDGVLDVGTLVEVDSRTWPGINKLGGSARIVRVHRETGKDGRSEDIFYDVRYVLGGFEKHLESEYVHSSELLNQQSNREIIDRDYYAETYIDKPHQKKQEEAERKRLLAAANAGHNGAAAPHTRKRKRSHRVAREQPVAHKVEDNDGRGRTTARKLDENTFMLTNSTSTSLEVSSKHASEDETSTKTIHAMQSPPVKKPSGQRRRHRISDSSDEESSSGEEKDASRNVSPEPRAQQEHTDTLFKKSAVNGSGAEARIVGRSTDHHHSRRKKHKSSRRRFVGGYEQNGEDADARFIQPEGDPAELPEDVLRATGIELATTKKGLMVQLQDIFAEQQKHLADFRKEQTSVDQKLMKLEQIPLSDLQKLPKKVNELDTFVTKTLVNAGEDVMNKIIEVIKNKRGKTPTALEGFEFSLDNWQDDLKECSQWVRSAKAALENAFERRQEVIPQEEATQAVYASDSGESSHSADNYDASALPNDTMDPASNQLDFSYDYVPPETLTTTRNPKSQSKRPKTTTRKHRNFFLTSTTLDDFFPRGEAKSFRPNLRLTGRQRNINPSDPRWNWVKLARKKQRRVGTTMQAARSSSIPSGVGCNVHEPRSTNGRSRDDSMSIQSQRIHLRDKRFRGQSTQNRSRETFFARPAPQSMRSASQAVFPTGIRFDDGSPEKRLRPAEPAMPTIPPSSSKQQPVNWETIFEVVSEDPCLSAIGDNHKAISRQRQETLLGFGHPICGALVPRTLLSGNGLEFEDSENFRDIVVRRTARLRQFLSDLRLHESDFMDFLSRGSLDGINEEEYMNTSEWVSLISLEEAFHTAIASFAAQTLEALETFSPPTFLSHLRTVLEEVATLIRQLPDCEALFGGCKAYFFFFEVASRDVATTPLLTAISRTYWYCLTMLVAVGSKCVRLLAPDTKAKQTAGNLFLKILPVNRVILAVVLFLFDLHLYLPSSHRLSGSESDTPWGGPIPALSLWLLVRGCCTSAVGFDQGHQESLVTTEKHFWALVQALYRQRYFDELARCFVRSESCGGYLREFTPKISDDNEVEHRNEVMESQLLALESTWDLLTVLSRVYIHEEGSGHENVISDARWAVVKDLLHPEKQSFLPFKLSNLQPSYIQHADTYKLHVLKRITGFSKQWHPCKDIIEIIVRQLWENEASNQPNDILELPQLMKQFITQCKELGNSTSQLTAFAEASISDELDSPTELCRIIWIQFLKLEKRVHRQRFRSSVLKAIPSTVDVMEKSTVVTPGQGATTLTGRNWVWDPKQRAAVSAQPAKPSPRTVLQQSPTIPNAGKERMSIAVLLSFAVLEICKECGDAEQFPINRAEKDVRYLEREVNFYCNEIFRWTARKLACEVIAAQALYTIGALLLEKNSTEFSVVFRGLNEKLASAMENLQANPIVIPTQKELLATANASNTRDLEKRRRRFRGAAMASLYQMRDLVKKLVEMPTSGVTIGHAFGPAVEKSLEHIFSVGVQACLSGAMRKLIADRDLKIAMEIFQLVLPRATDEPNQCAPREFRELEDMDNLLMNWDGNGAAPKSPPIPAWTVENCRSKAIHLITTNLRVVLQQLVLNYPQTEGPTFDELYAIDLLGMTISTCEVQFLWSNMRSTSAKARNLAPRVLSAALKYNPKKEWLGNVFLRERGSDHELATAWLLRTLDVSALDSTPISFKVEDIPFSVVNNSLAEASSAMEEMKNSVRDSDSWVMLTDGIIYHMLRDKPVGLFTMDLQILQLLRGISSTCKFPKAVRNDKDKLHDVAVLYDLHLDVFQSFCRSAGTMWSSYTAAPAIHRDEMNRFRVKMMDSRSGIFVTFLEAYKLNFRRACDEIDQVNHDWHLFAKLFLRHTGVNATGGRSYHQLDDTIKAFDERLTGLTTMFRFMYQCVDAFLFNCGEMAIGKNNLFFNAMELLFRQVNSAEYPQAIKRMNGERTLDQCSGVRDLNVQLRKGFCTQAMTFVDSVQLFFARQKYPSLLHWFALTSEIYQTFTTGWKTSPLRTLLLNILDPDGPLGIYTYYPGDEVSNDSTLNVDVRTVRREAFYLSCGLFNCTCTRSFEHSRAKSSLQSCERLQQLREFVLDDFMRDTFEFGQKNGTTCLLETMVPICQLVRSVLNHANLNANMPNVTRAEENGVDSGCHSQNSHDFQLNELHPCLEWMVECLIKIIPAGKAVNSSISCVLLIELCGIICEAIAFNEHRPLLELIDLVEVVLSYLQAVYVALANRTTAVMAPLFAASVESPLFTRLNAYHFTSSEFRGIAVKQDSNQEMNGLMESYGINMARATTDLVAAITRVAQQCKTSSDERLRSFTTISS